MTIVIAALSAANGNAGIVHRVKVRSRSMEIVPQSLLLRPSRNGPNDA